MNKKSIWYCSCLPPQPSLDPKDHAPGCAFVRIAELEAKFKSADDAGLKLMARHLTLRDGLRKAVDKEDTESGWTPFIDTLRELLDKESEDESE